MRKGQGMSNAVLQRSPNKRGIVSDRSGHKAVTSITGVATKIIIFSAGQTVS